MKKTIPLTHVQGSGVTEEPAGHSAYTSAVAEISQHCLYSVCDVWVTSCLEKEQGFLLLLSVVCQSVGIRERRHNRRLAV